MSCRIVREGVSGLRFEAMLKEMMLFLMESEGVHIRGHLSEYGMKKGLDRVRKDSS